MFTTTTTEPVKFTYQLIKSIPDMDTKLSNGLIDILCSEAWVTRESLFTELRKRSRGLVEARQIIMSFRCLVLNMPTSLSGKVFRKDHATVLHSIDQVKTLFGNDKTYRKKYRGTFEYIFKVCPEFMKLTVKEIQIKRNESGRTNL